MRHTNSDFTRPGVITWCGAVQRAIIVGMNREQALEILHEFTKSENLRRHALAVEACVSAYARKLGTDEEKWSDHRTAA